MKYVVSVTFLAANNRYESLAYNRVGRSGLLLPALSLGLWQNFGDTTPRETQRTILRRAFDLGITHFDLANNYGPPYGSAETNFGQIFQQDFRAYRDELIISSKAGYDMWPGPYGDHGSRKYLRASLDASLGRMGIDYVDVFYHHRPDADTPIEETAGALATAVNQGKALYVGVSNYGPEETIGMQAALAAHNIPLTIHQPRYSMFDRHVENGLFPALEAIGAGCIVFSPLAQGLLTDRYLDGRVPEDSRAATSKYLNGAKITETYLERARGLDEIASARGQSLAQLALTWVLRDSAVTSAVIGASSVIQLESNIAALSAAPLTAEELTAIDAFAVHGTAF